MEECDLLIMLGTSFPYRDYLPDDTPAIQLDSDPAKIGKRYPVTAGLVCDSALGLRELTEYIERKEDRRFLNACTEHMQHWWNEIEKMRQRQQHRLNLSRSWPVFRKRQPMMRCSL